MSEAEEVHFKEKVGEKGEVQYEIPAGTPHILLLFDGVKMRFFRRGALAPHLKVATAYLDVIAEIELKLEIMPQQMPQTGRIVRPH